VTDGVDTRVLRQQAPAAHTPRDRGTRQAGVHELLSAHDAPLERGEAGDHEVWGVLSVHMTL
jgi:hypothetical protein